jgi:hypothetical protein
VSGDVTLVDGGDGATSRLVRTAATLFGTPGFAPAALVGGLAVTCRLATVHRATNDVDTVADGDRPGDLALEYLGDSDAGAGRIEIEGVTVDVMATHPIDERDLPDDELARLFVVSHRWALETATSLAVDVVAGGQIIESASLQVATVPALVACKLHAIADRRDARAAKRESDALDLVRLVGEVVREPAHAESLRAAPHDLAALASTQISRWFVDDALRTSRLARLAGAELEPADIEALGQLWRSTVGAE